MLPIYLLHTLNLIITNAIIRTGHPKVPRTEAALMLHRWMATGTRCRMKAGVCASLVTALIRLPKIDTYNNYKYYIAVAILCHVLHRAVGISWFVYAH